MKLSSGSVVINKNISNVFRYCCRTASLIADQQLYGLEDYELELDDDLEEFIQEDDEITLYAYGKYENNKDWILDLRILKISKENFITFRIERIGYYENENSEYKDVKPVPLSFIWNRLEYGIIFYDLEDSTRIEFINYIKPSAGTLFKILAYVLYLFGFFKNREIMGRWANSVERNA